MISYSRVTLMREQSRAEVYFVYGGAKFWIQSSSAFDALGFDWSKVQVVPDGALSALPAKTLDSTTPTKASDVFFRAAPWNVVDAGDVYQPLMSKDPAHIVRKNVIVAGWLTDAGDFGQVNCWTTPGQTSAGIPYVTEDYHYDVVLDADFIAQMYGTGGLSTALNGIVLPGNLSGSGSGPALRFDDLSDQDLSSRGVTMNSFSLPHMAGLNPPDVPAGAVGRELVSQNYIGSGPVYVHGEVNCWHANDGPFGVRQYYGRGPAPSGWFQWARCNEPDADAWWPFNIDNPDGGPRGLELGDYLLMKGTLWQEHAHDIDSPSPWRAEIGTLMHCGLLEMHPPDWIARVQAPPIRKTAYMFAVCTDSQPTAPTIRGDATMYPYPYLKPPPDPAAQFMWRKLVDGRFTHLNTYSDECFVEPAANANPPILGSLAVAATVTPKKKKQQGKLARLKQGRFKAVYEVWWQMPLMASVMPERVAVGSRVTFHVYAEDSATHAPVAGTVMAAGQPIGSTGTVISYVFERLDTPLTLSAPGYRDIAVPLTLVPGWLRVTSTPIQFNVPIPVTVTAINAVGETVTGEVRIAGKRVGDLGKEFTYTFHPVLHHPVSSQLGKGPPGDGGDPTPPPGLVIAAGYLDAGVPWDLA
jgi:hypothetical protein